MNKQVTIQYYLPKLYAIAAGSTRYGDGEFTITEEQLAELSKEEAVYVASLYGRLSIEGLPTWEGIRAAIVASSAKEVAEKCAAAERLEAKILAVLATPLAELVDREGIVSTYRFHAVPFDDPRIKKLRAAAHEYGAPRRAEVQVEKELVAAREIARRDAWDTEAAKAEVAKEAFVEACRVFALTIPALARPASEHYSVTSAVIAHVCSALALAGNTVHPNFESEIIREGTKAWETFGWEEQVAPNARAFEVYDAVKAHIATVLVPEGLTLDLQRIMRVTKTAEDEYEERQVIRFTGVIVDVEAPGQPDRAVVFDTEN